MKRKNYLIISSIFLITTITININFTSAIEVNWPIGEPILYTYKESYKYSELNTAYDLLEEEEDYYEDQMLLNITEINQETKEVIYQEISQNNYTYTDYQQYDVDSVCSQSLDPNYAFYIQYNYDSSIGKVYLSYFDFYIIESFFIEPNWTGVNAYFKELFDPTTVVDVIYYTYPEIVITLGDFLNNISYDINGQNTLDGVISSFSNNKHKWTFTFDLSNVICSRLWNGWEYYYQYYDLYLYTYELEYSNDGLLNGLRFSERMSYERNGYIRDYSIMYEIFSESIDTPAFGYTSLITLVFIPIALVAFVKKRYR